MINDITQREAHTYTLDATLGMFTSLFCRHLIALCLSVPFNLIGSSENSISTSVVDRKVFLKKNSKNFPSGDRQVMQLTNKRCE